MTESVHWFRPQDDMHTYADLGSCMQKKWKTWYILANFGDTVEGARSALGVNSGAWKVFPVMAAIIEVTKPNILVVASAAHVG
jgi:hypothetical protein